MFSVTIKTRMNEGESQERSICLIWEMVSWMINAGIKWVVFQMVTVSYNWKHRLIRWMIACERYCRLHSHIKCVAEFDDLKNIFIHHRVFYNHALKSHILSARHRFQNQQTIALGSWLEKNKNIISGVRFSK